MAVLHDIDMFTVETAKLFYKLVLIEMSCFGGSRVHSLCSSKVGALDKYSALAISTKSQ